MKIQIDKLDGSNYDSWKLLMKSLLIQNELCNVTCGSIVKTENNAKDFDKVDQKALAAIMLNVKTQLLMNIKNCKTAAECWGKLEMMYKHTGPGRKVTLFKTLIHARVQQDGRLDEHVNKFTEVVEKLSELGITIQDEVLSILLLCSLPSSYENFVVAIESRDTLPTLENLKIKIVEEELRKSSKNNAELENVDNNALLSSESKSKKNYSNRNFKCYTCLCATT